MPDHLESQGFDEPPIGRAEEEETAATAPADVGVEAPAVSGAPGVLAEVPPALLEVKDAIERQLARQAAATAGAASVEALQGAGNIQGVAIGLGGDGGKLTAGVEPGTPMLTVYVAEPTSEGQVRSVLASSVGAPAAAAEAVPLNVVVTGIIDAASQRFRIRPAPGGVSIGHFRITAGTLGCLATGRSAPRDSRLLLLSNNHVVANSNDAGFGDCISQPAPADGGQCPADQIAFLERFVPIDFAGGANVVDCGTGWCWPDRVRRELAYLSGGTLSYFRIGSVPVAPALGMTVGKTGRTTQLTAGRVTGIAVTVNVNYSGRLALFRDQIAIQGNSGDFSAGGDSGSSIWTWDSARRPVGLLFAGGGGTTFANRMDRVLPALDIELYT